MWPTTITSYLKENTTISSIDFYSNKIAIDWGTKAIAHILKVNTTLTSLYLNGNKIGDQGAQAFADMFKVNTTLTSLDLSLNQISDQGAKAFAEFLEVNTTLTSLVLGGNRIGHQNMDAIIAIINRNIGLRDQCIDALSRGDSQGAVQLFEQGVSLNGVLLELIKSVDVNLEPIQTLFKITQDKNNNLSMTRGTIVEALNIAQDRHDLGVEVITFLEQCLNQFPTDQIAQEEKVEPLPTVHNPYPSPCCAIMQTKPSNIMCN